MTASSGRMEKELDAEEDKGAWKLVGEGDMELKLLLASLLPSRPCEDALILSSSAREELLLLVTSRCSLRERTVNFAQPFAFSSVLALYAPVLLSSLELLLFVCIAGGDIREESKLLDTSKVLAAAFERLLDHDELGPRSIPRAPVVVGEGCEDAPGAAIPRSDQALRGITSERSALESVWEDAAVNFSSQGPADETPYEDEVVKRSKSSRQIVAHGSCGLFAAMRLRWRSRVDA